MTSIHRLVPVRAALYPVALASGVLLGTLGGCDDPDDASDVCGCFETNGTDQFDVTCSFVEDHGSCGTYVGCSESDDACPSAELEAANAEVVQCALARLSAGEAGTFHYTRSEIAFEYNDHYVLNGDGTTVSWSENSIDLNTEVSAVELREVPAAADVDACAGLASTEAQWDCVVAAVVGAEGIETCTSALSWESD